MCDGWKWIEISKSFCITQFCQSKYRCNVSRQEGNVLLCANVTKNLRDVTKSRMESAISVE